MREPKWETKITDVKENEIRIFGYKIDDLMGNKSFADTVFLLFKGTLPTREQGKMLDAIMVACADHGVTPPSTLAALMATSTGAPLNGALAAGILSINEFHGGAIENTMKMLLELDGVLNSMKKKSLEEKDAIINFIREYKNRNKKIPGFGHRFHTKDPRTAKLLDFADEIDISGKYVNLLLSISKHLPYVIGKSLPINVDGSIGALLLELGIQPYYGNAVFIMSRIPGLIAHIIEEKQMQKRMRKINLGNCIYTGVQPRNLKE